MVRLLVVVAFGVLVAWLVNYPGMPSIVAGFIVLAFWLTVAEVW